MISSLTARATELLLQGKINPVAMKQLTICVFAQVMAITVCGQSVRFPLNCAYTSAGVYSIHFSDVFAPAANPGAPVTE